MSRGEAGSTWCLGWMICLQTREAGRRESPEGPGLSQCWKLSFPAKCFQQTVEQNIYQTPDSGPCFGVKFGTIEISE